MFKEILSQIKYKDWLFVLGGLPDRPYLQVRFLTECARGAGYQHQHGRKWMLSPHMTRSEVVATAFKAVITAEEHEARELFKYKGKAVFCAHYDVDALVDLHGRQEFDVRPEVGA